MVLIKVRLEKFGKENYSELISWIDNEEALMQFAGPLLKFPLTMEQLDILLADKNRFAFRVVENQSNLSIGHAEIYLSKDSAKIGRIVIGVKEKRGLGFGKQLVALLLEFIFNNFKVSLVELNVFDWNIEAIKCYEKNGFTLIREKKLQREINNKVWTVLNMTINRVKYENLKDTIVI